jgi:hypothetical protein
MGAMPLKPWRRLKADARCVYGYSPQRRPMLNKAIRLHTGSGAASFPKDDANQVRSELSATEAEAAVQQIKSLWAELGALKPDWKTQTLASASQMGRRANAAMPSRVGRKLAGCPGLDLQLLVEIARRPSFRSSM